MAAHRISTPLQPSRVGSAMRPRNRIAPLFLSPERVRHGHLVVATARRVEPLDGLAPGSGLGHAKGSPNAERREEQVVGPLPQCPVHREREVAVVLGERLRAALSRTRVRQRGATLRNLRCCPP